MSKESFITSSASIVSQLTAAPSVSSHQVILQGLIELYGLPNIEHTIREADLAEEQINHQVRSAIENFEETPNLESRNKLIRILQGELDRLEKTPSKGALTQKDSHQQPSDNKPASEYFTEWFKTIRQGISSLLGSVAPPTVEPDQPAPDKHSPQKQALTKYISELNSLDFQEQTTPNDGVPSQSTQPQTTVAKISIARPISTSPHDSADTPPLFPPEIRLSELDKKTGFVIKAENEIIGSAIAVGHVYDNKMNDILIGSPHHLSASGQEVGGAYLVRGSSNLGEDGQVSLTTDPGITRIEGETAFQHQQTGFAVNILENLTTDGRSAPLISAPYYSGQTGRSYTIYGESLLNQTAVFQLAGINGLNGKKFIGQNPGDFSGWSISSSDLNGDQRPELLFGSPGHPTPQSAFGMGYVLFGNKLDNNPEFALGNLSTPGGFTIATTTPHGQLGYTIAGIGDFDGDGYGDFAISRPYTSDVFVVYGSTNIGNSGSIVVDDLNSYRGTRFIGESAGDLTGFTIGSIKTKDVSHLLLGAPGRGKTGSVYLLRGGMDYGREFSLAGLNTTFGSVIDGPVGDNIGLALGGLGNIGGNTVPYFGIGSPDFNHSTGRTFIVGYQNDNNHYYNLSSLDGNNGFVVYGGSKGGRSGSTVVAGGDLRGNYGTSVLIGAGKSDGVSVIFGKPNVPDTPSSSPDYRWIIIPIAVGVPLSILMMCGYCQRHKIKRRIQQCVEGDRQLRDDEQLNIADQKHNSSTDNTISKSISGVQEQEVTIEMVILNQAPLNLNVPSSDDPPPLESSSTTPLSLQQSEEDKPFGFSEPSLSTRGLVSQRKSSSSSMAEALNVPGIGYDYAKKKPEELTEGHMTQDKKLKHIYGPLNNSPNS